MVIFNVPDPIPLQLARLRDAYVLHLVRIEASDMDPLFRRAAMKMTQQGIDELERQIANLEAPAERLHDDVYEAKRYADCHEQ